MARRPADKNQQNTGTRSKNAGQLRIIGGEWRSRKLPIVDLPGLRPTSDRVRETVFNWLTPYIPGAKVLDCFSGTGALAFESLSRGAQSAILLESAMPAVKSLNANLQTLNGKNTQVVHTDSLNWLQQESNTAFDLIFLDPPFRKGLLEDTCRLLTENGYINKDTLIYIEVEKELQPLPVPSNWKQLKAKTAGQLSYYLYQSSLS